MTLCLVGKGRYPPLPLGDGLLFDQRRFRREDRMSDVYDRELAATLMDEARKLTAALKIEADAIKVVIDTAFDGDDEDVADVVEEGVAVPPRFKWRFWR
jgi:hypothetical protein